MSKKHIPTVAELRKQGYKVRVFHQRQKVAFAKLIPREFRHDIVKMTEGLVPEYFTRGKGGVTRVELTTPEGEHLIGESPCSKSDMYAKKEGVKKAIARALGSKKHEERIHIGDRVVVMYAASSTEDVEREGQVVDIIKFTDRDTLYEVDLGNDNIMEFEKGEILRKVTDENNRFENH